MGKSTKYYLNSAKLLGWDKTAQLDKQRLYLIKKFLFGKKILDVGCGYGLYVDYLSSQGFDVMGVDFVDDFITLARKTKKGKFVKGQAHNLPFENYSFETVLLFDILEHGDDKEILSEAKRISKKRILAIVPRKVDYQLEQSGVIFRHYLDKSHLREYEKEDIKNLAKKVNLKLIHLEEVHPLYNETIFLSLFEGNIIFKKIIRKIVFLLLPKKIYHTEYFAVFEK